MKLNIAIISQFYMNYYSMLTTKNMAWMRNFEILFTRFKVWVLHMTRNILKILHRDR
jgi:hypothetical protein